MLKIYKYPLKITDTQWVPMPLGARILSVGEQRGELNIWALVDPQSAPVPHLIWIFGTGNPIQIEKAPPLEDEFDLGRFIGTVQCANGLVWHVFHRFTKN